jgi:hypothetical protein
MSYLHINWPTEKTLGRYTISPDHMALKVQDKQLKVVHFYLDGKSVENNKKRHLIATLKSI